MNRHKVGQRRRLMRRRPQTQPSSHLSSDQDHVTSPPGGSRSRTVSAKKSSWRPNQAFLKLVSKEVRYSKPCDTGSLVAFDGQQDELFSLWVQTLVDTFFIAFGDGHAASTCTATVHYHIISLLSVSH